jgi:uncharacterized protein
MITLIPLKDNFTIYQVTDYNKIPPDIFKSCFFSITSTGEEISIITNCTTRFGDIKSSEGWKGFRVEGMLDFSMVGIINEITKPLKDNRVSVFVISTYNTDYIFVKCEFFERSLEIFRRTENIAVQD